MLLWQELLLDTLQNLISSGSFSGKYFQKIEWKSQHRFGLWNTGVTHKIYDPKLWKSVAKVTFIARYTAQNLSSSRSFSGEPIILYVLIWCDILFTTWFTCSYNNSYYLMFYITCEFINLTLKLWEKTKTKTRNTATPGTLEKKVLV